MNKTQLDAVRAFIASEANMVQPPESFKFAVPCGRGGWAQHLRGKLGVPVVSERHVSDHVTWFSVALEVKECIVMPQEDVESEYFCYAPTYIVPAEILLKVFAVINRFPEEYAILRYDEVRKFF